MTDASEPLLFHGDGAATAADSDSEAVAVGRWREGAQKMRPKDLTTDDPNLRLLHIAVARQCPMQILAVHRGGGTWR